mmetsp:Transcript_27448/g.5050  ORF Transcript_27448/g.5050 Transcript_27448/m.5050 type:complete len:82 (+) Transcript_27448:255-500(+)
MFNRFAPNYFRHVCKNFYHGMPSCLVKTLGVFRIGTKNLTTGRWKIDWVVIYQNIGFNMPPNVMTYDLKGTRNSRRYVKQT